MDEPEPKTIIVGNPKGNLHGIFLDPNDIEASVAAMEALIRAVDSEALGPDEHL